MRLKFPAVGGAAAGVGEFRGGVAQIHAKPAKSSSSANATAT